MDRKSSAAHSAEERERKLSSTRRTTAQTTISPKRSPRRPPHPRGKLSGLSKKPAPPKKAKETKADHDSGPRGHK